MMRMSVQLTANFERNLDAIETFLDDAGAAHAFDALLEELAETVIPNLERFPDMGRSLLERPIRSVETDNAAARLRDQLAALTLKGDIREYLLDHYLLLYARLDTDVHLLSIRHHRQLSFDLASHWPA